MNFYRPRCKGRCGDFECEEAELKWRQAHTLGADDVDGSGGRLADDDDEPEPIYTDFNPIMEDAQDGPYIESHVPIVVIESPYGGENVERNVRYLRAAIRDSLDRGEAPFASHGLYTTGVDDTFSKDRSNDIAKGFRFRDVCEYTVVYTDLGISQGMELGIRDSKKKCKPVKYRTLPGWGKEEAPTK
jgi:hypothetical protein